MEIGIESLTLMSELNLAVWCTGRTCRRRELFRSLTTPGVWSIELPGESEREGQKEEGEDEEEGEEGSGVVSERGEDKQQYTAFISSEENPAAKTDLRSAF